MSSFKVELQFNGTVVAAENGVVDGAAADSLEQVITDNEIIKSPPDILVASTRPHTPPGPLLDPGMQLPERVFPPGLQQLAEHLPLLNREPCSALVALRPRQVDLLVRDVQVPAKDGGLGLLEVVQVGREVGVELGSPVREAGQSLSGVRDVGGHQVKPVELKGEDAPLLVMLRNADVLSAGYWLVL